ncbi:MAG: nucleotide exchange factor GrpE [Mycoplasmoidaceae bacterium]|nr:MAG: nucleotide exchange factor GrpE [Mycoplasmoidaceae bacterium]
MSEKKNKTEKINKKNDETQHKKETVVLDKNDNKPVVDYKLKYDNLIEELNNLQNKNIRLEQQIQSINIEYANKIKEKAEQANKIVADKLKELDSKHSQAVENTKKYGIEKDAGKLVDIIEQFKRAISFESTDPKVNQFLVGFKMFATMFDNLLDNMGIKNIIVKVGDEFMPDFMDAFDTTSDSNMNDNVVSFVISNAYKLHDRVIKHAVVKVNKHA